jgi:hypothetical protein
MRKILVSCLDADGSFRAPSAILTDKAISNTHITNIAIKTLFGYIGRNRMPVMAIARLAAMSAL